MNREEAKIYTTDIIRLKHNSIMIKLSIDFPVPEEVKEWQRKKRRERAKRNKALREYADKWISKERFYIRGNSFGRIVKYEINDYRLEFRFEEIDVFESDWEHRKFWHNRSLRVGDRWTILYVNDLQDLREVENPQECVKVITEFLSKTADEFVGILKTFDIKAATKKTEEN